MSTRKPNRSEQFAFNFMSSNHHGQPITVQPEDPALYDAVCILRGIGYRVYRAGEAHKVGDKLLSTPQVFRLAKSLQRGIAQDDD